MQTIIFFDSDFLSNEQKRLFFVAVQLVVIKDIEWNGGIVGIAGIAGIAVIAGIAMFIDVCGIMSKNALEVAAKIEVTIVKIQY